MNTISIVFNFSGKLMLGYVPIPCPFLGYLWSMLCYSVPIKLFFRVEFNNLVKESKVLLFSHFYVYFSGAEIGRFVAMLRNASPILRSCAAFALLQVEFSFI